VRLNRRTALKAGVAFAGASAALLGAHYLARSDGPLADSFAARAIGERFATRFPDPTGLWRGQVPSSADEWPARLSALIADDLDHDRLIEVDGWWLAETEVRLCVLVYTSQG
jgi:hypothetical protein